MKPGPTLIVKPRGCKQPVKLSTFASGNTFRAKFWTDGKCEAPMLPDDLWLQKSPSEGVLFWSDECREIDRIELGHKNPKWEDLPYAEEPTEKDYFAAIDSKLANTDEKRTYIRTRIWWLGNDKIRRRKASELPPKHIRNLKALVLLPLEDDPEPEQILMRADALRELSRFDEALALLEATDWPEEVRNAVALIKKLAESRKPRVAKIPQ